MGCNSSTLAKIRIARTFQSLLTSRSKGGSTFCHVKSTGFSFLFKTWFFLFQTEEQFARFGFSDKRGVKDEFK